MNMKKRLLALMLFMMLVPVSSIFAQNTRYNFSAFRPEFVNPAYRFENRLVDINVIYALPDDNDVQNIGLNAHSQFLDNMGIGLRANYGMPSDLRNTITGGISYNYNLKLNDDMEIAFGIGGGVDYWMYKGDLSDQAGKTNPYGELGVAYRWTNLYIGLSAMGYFGQDETNIDLTLTARYDFNVGAGFYVSPLIAYTMESKYRGDGPLHGPFEGGVMARYSKWAELGATYTDTNRMNIYASVWASDYGRVFYNCSLGITETQQNFNKAVHEIGIRFYLNK